MDLASIKAQEADKIYFLRRKYRTLLEPPVGEINSALKNNNRPVSLYVLNVV